MNLLFTLLLALLTISNYYASRKQFMAPSVIVSGVFTLSAFALTINIKNWNYVVSVDSILVVLTCLILFSVASNVRVGFRIRDRWNKTQRSAIFASNYTIRRKTLLVLTVPCVAITGIYFVYQYMSSVVLGNAEGVDGMLYTLRDAEGVSTSLVLRMGLSYVQAVGFVCCYLQVNNIIYKRRKYLELVPILCMVACMAFSTGRGGLITVVCAILFDVYIVMKQRGYKIRTGKMIKQIGGGLLLFAVAFWMIGIWLRKDEVYSFFDTFSIYIGSSVLNFDYLLTELTVTPDNKGASTFVGLYNLLRMLGIDTDVRGFNFPYNRWNGIKYGSNVYSSFAFYYTDFGLVGLFLMMLIMGYLCGSAWRKFNRMPPKSILLFTYGRYWGYACAMFSIAERICSQYLAMNVLAEIVVEWILIRYLIKEISADDNRLRRTDNR